MPSATTKTGGSARKASSLTSRTRPTSRCPGAAADLRHPHLLAGHERTAPGAPVAGSVVGCPERVRAAAVHAPWLSSCGGGSDDRLSRLLRDRPDLATPAPHDSAQLAARAATRASVSRALDQLTLPELVFLMPSWSRVKPDRPARLDRPSLGGQRGRGGRAADRPGPGLGVPRRAAGPERGRGGTCGGYGAGGQRGAARLPRSPGPWTPCAGTSTRSVQPPWPCSGTSTTAVARRPPARPADVTPEDAESPAEELLARRLLVVRSGSSAWVPGEVGLTLRGGRDHGRPGRRRTGDRDVRTLLRTGRPGRGRGCLRGGTARGAAAGPLGDPASGGPAQRRGRRTRPQGGGRSPACRRAHRGAARRGGLRRASLLALGTDEDGDQAWLPTDAYDRWCAQPVEDRWVTLAAAWLATSRLPGLVRDAGPGRKTRNALAPEMSSVFSAETADGPRGAGGVPPGEVLAAGTGVPSVARRWPGCVPGGPGRAPTRWAGR